MLESRVNHYYLRKRAKAEKLYLSLRAEDNRFINQGEVLANKNQEHQVLGGACNRHLLL